MSSDDNLASARWHRLVTDRLEEMQRLSPDLESLSGGFWDRRADRYAATANLADTEGDPFLRRLCAAADESSTAIDVGAGTGRYALPLATGLRHLTAVDPSAAMLAILRRDATQLAITNLTTIQSTWEQAGTAGADIVFSSFVLTLVPDAPAFVTKLEAAARRHVFLYLGAYCGDAVLDPLWRHFHGGPRAPGPSYLDALAVLRELGITPEVKTVEIPNRKRFATIDEATEHYRDGLLLADTNETRRELEGLLRTWLLGRKGALRSPLRTVPAAIIHWTPKAPT
jgi:SAM-dependent methyltransferase